MVNTCCVPACNSGYRSNKNGKKVALFQFPINSELRDKWYRAIPRQNWKVSKSHKVCAQHFHESDFKTISTDTCSTRRKSRSTLKLQRVHLKPDAVPKIFPSLPKYLSSPLPTMRATSSTSSSFRREKDNIILQKQNADFLIQDSFSDFSSFRSKMKNAVLPFGYTSVYSASSAQFYFVKNDDSYKVAPELVVSVIISSELQIKAFVFSNLIPKDQYMHLLSCGSLQTVTEVSNILAWCKALADMSNFVSNNQKSALKLAISLLKSYLSDEAVVADLSQSSMSLVCFIIEQLNLLQVSKHGRRYSTATIISSYMWQLTSTALYKKLQEFFILPSINRLRQLSVGTTVETGEITLNYLHQRTVNLTSEQKIVTLLVDEVYTAQRVEYSNGSFVGLTADGAPAKTALTFMVNSTCSNYKDVVCIIFVNKLNTKILCSWFKRVMFALDKFFLVIAVSVDNHICNRCVFVSYFFGNFLNFINIILHLNVNSLLFLILFLTYFAERCT